MNYLLAITVTYHTCFVSPKRSDILFIVVLMPAFRERHGNLLVEFASPLILTSEVFLNSILTPRSKISAQIVHLWKVTFFWSQWHAIDYFAIEWKEELLWCAPGAENLIQEVHLLFPQATSWAQGSRAAARRYPSVTVCPSPLWPLGAAPLRAFLAQLTDYEMPASRFCGEAAAVSQTHYLLLQRARKPTI